MSAEVFRAYKPSESPFILRQRTLRHSISFSGKGLFTGSPIDLTIYPAKAGHGIAFQRSDHPGAPLLKASLSSVKATPRCTVLGNERFQVQTVEHLLSALSAFHIDNALIVLSGPEIPIDDGSSLIFTQKIKEAGVEDLKEKRTAIAVSSPLFFSDEDTHIIALPSHEFRISYTLHYPHSPLIRTQFYTVGVDEESYEKQIAPSRTFCLYEEIAPLVERGLIKGGGLDSAVIIAEDRVLNPEGLRFRDEMVRHKILDLIGDLSLIGVHLLVHIIAIRSGHSTNIAFARLLEEQVNRGSSQ